MGAHPYWYFTPYDPDIEAALQKLRRQEFEAGRYNPVMRYIEFPIDPAAPSPGPQHLSIDQARAAADAEGTRSILDIDGIGDAPDFGTAAALDDDTLQDLFETTEPTRETVESNFEVFDRIDRGRRSTSSSTATANQTNCSLPGIPSTDNARPRCAKRTTSALSYA